MLHRNPERMYRSSRTPLPEPKGFEFKLPTKTKANIGGDAIITPLLTHLTLNPIFRK